MKNNCCLQAFETPLDWNGHHLSIVRTDFGTRSSKMTNNIARRESLGRDAVKIAVAVGDEQNNR